MAISRLPRPRRRTLVALTLLSAVLITLDVRGNSLIQTTKEGARDAFSPVQRIIGGSFEGVNDWVAGVIRAGSLRDENEKLRRELEESKASKARTKRIEEENRELTKLLKLENIDDIPSVVARVVGGSPSDFSWTVEINRGEDDGVQIGMPVVASDGLVGRVLESSSNRATVLLITDPSSGVGARLNRSGEKGVVRGRAGKQTLRLEFVPADVPVRDGEKVVTSGLEGGRFPPGLPVGEVVEAENRSESLQQDIIVEPYVDTTRLEFVKVLRWSGNR